MRPVRVNRTDLINKLLENKSKHVQEFREVYELFRDKAIRQMERNLELARDTNATNVVLSISLATPVSHEQDYDDALGLLQMGTDETVELDMESYRQYIQDNWVWKRSFDATNSLYKS